MAPVDVIGVGNVATVLARRLSPLGVEVMLSSSRDPERLAVSSAAFGVLAGSVRNADPERA